MGAAEEKFLNDRQAQKDSILHEIEQNRIKCLNELFPQLRRLCTEFHALNESLGFPQQPEVYSESDGVSGWFINKIQLPDLPYEENEHYHNDRVWLTNEKIARYVYGVRGGDRQRNGSITKGVVPDIASEYVESAFINPKDKANPRIMPYPAQFKSQDKVKELEHYIKIVRQRIDLLQRSQTARTPRKSFSLKEWLLGYK